MMLDEMITKECTKKILCEANDVLMVFSSMLGLMQILLATEVLCISKFLALHKTTNFCFIILSDWLEIACTPNFRGQSCIVYVRTKFKLISIQKWLSWVGLGCRINQLHLCRGAKSPLPTSGPVGWGCRIH